jgi:hypothetical protein
MFHFEKTPAARALKEKAAWPRKGRKRLSIKRGAGQAGGRP